MKRNGFCFLVDTLPKALNFNGKTIALDTRTCTALSVLLFLRSPEPSNLEKSQYACRLLKNSASTSLKDWLDYLGVTEQQLAGAFIKYLRGYPEVKSYKELTAEAVNSPDTGLSQKTVKLPSFDFVQDSDAILSAFRQVYGMTYEQVRECHWWEFLALFNNLPDGTTFNAIRKIREMKIDPKASAQHKADIRRAKQDVALVDTRTPEQKKADLQSQLDNLEL